MVIGNEAVRVDEFEQVVGHFLATLPQADHTVVIVLDGRTLRGTIPLGQTCGVPLLAAYLPGEGLVLMQVEVAGHENAISAASHACSRSCAATGALRVAYIIAGM